MATVVRTAAALRAALAAEPTGFVPTMGALHAGHLALVGRSARENRRTVVSVFVNPTQFDDAADLSGYPRDLDRDAALAATAGADLVFAPPVEAVYPPGFATTVAVVDLGERWEGAARPGHFRAVGTVVARLLGLVRPARTYFGEKDFQQLQIVRRLHFDLALPGTIVACPTVRDPDGLALSSRNARLSAAGRAAAAAIPRALAEIVDRDAAGERDAARLVAAGRQRLDPAPGLVVEYLAIVDGETLEPVGHVGAACRVLVAAQIEGVRLLDNRALPVERGPTQDQPEGDNDERR